MSRVQAILIVTTFGSEAEADLIGRELVRQRLAACANVVPGIRSIYRWQGEVRSESEALLLVKTLDSRFAEAARTIQELHTYELPEIVAVPIALGEPRFLAWIASCVDPTSPLTETRIDRPEEPLPTVP